MIFFHYHSLTQKGKCANKFGNLKLLGVWTLSIVWYSKKLENTMFQKLDLFPSSGERGDTYSVG
jgi:hypothetical protein